MSQFHVGLAGVLMGTVAVLTSVRIQKYWIRTAGLSARQAWISGLTQVSVGAAMVYGGIKALLQSYSFYSQPLSIILMATLVLLACPRVVRWHFPSAQGREYRRLLTLYLCSIIVMIVYLGVVGAV